MQLRLAFSLATALRPEILLIDEALAVGDAYFQQKCIQRIRQFRELGTTLVLVSHDATAIRTLCDRALLMENGLLVREGTSDLLLDYYNAVIAKRSAEEEIRQAEVARGQPRQTRSGDRRVTIESVDLRDASGSSRALPVGARVQLVLEGRVRRAVDDLTVGFVIRDRLRNDVFGTNTHHLGIAVAPLGQDAGFRTEFRFPLNLGPGTYSMSVAFHAGPIHLLGSYDWWDNVCVFQVIPGAEPRFVGTNWLPVEASVEAGGERRGSA
jgi:lipopolysaccharide transport system ATP-binding protein